MKKLIQGMERLIQAYKDYNAYTRYKKVAQTYTTPLSYEAWKYQTTNLIYGC